MPHQFGTLAAVIAGEDQHRARVRVFAQAETALDENLVHREQHEPLFVGRETLLGTVISPVASEHPLYRRTLRQLEQLTGTKIARLHIVGGGSRNALLNQFAADALQIPVLAGPVEATAAGNILIQALALGHLPSLAAARETVRHSMKVEAFSAHAAAAWETAHARFEKLLQVQK